MPRAKSAQNAGWARQAAARGSQEAPRQEGQGGDAACQRAGVAVKDEPPGYEAAVFLSYQQALGASFPSPEDGGPVGLGEEGDSALQRIRDHLLSSQAGASVCLICLETIQAADPTWHCSGSCFVLLHLQCAQSWAQQQLTAARSRFDEKRRLFPHQPPNVPIVWGCPKCRQDYEPDELPRSYRCFCGKAEDPEFDPWKAPHSCGEICGRQLQGGCSHSCLLLCHPGPCPRCPREVDISCYCGKRSARRRCGHKGFSCETVCGKVLPCGHTCPEKCHKAPCPPCSLTDMHTCRCGAEQKLLACADRDWACGRVCGATLACGRHFCQLGCHAGSCGSCGLEGDRKCHCGKAVVKALQCDEPTPSCGETCGKMLACGLHACAERCHAGPCPDTCRKMVTKSCGCGKTQKEVPCFADVRCERRCPLQRQCGRHACKRRCCDGNCPPCPETCGRRLKCGNHRCPAPCHTGECLPCPLTATIACACGATRFTVPCGSERRVAPSNCLQPCRIPYTCRHRALPCGHLCGSPACHDPRPPPVPAYATPPPPQATGGGSFSRAGLSEHPPPALVLLQQIGSCEGAHQAECGPCMEPVWVPCLGGHKSLAMPCSTASPFSCEAPCGAPLQCGNHSCTLPCHLRGEAGCETCSRPCGVAKLCGHPCPRQCHPGPCDPCLETLERGCHCGKTQLTFVCHELEASGSLEAKLRCNKVCHRQLEECPHPCSRVCHSGLCLGAVHCEELVTVRCACKRVKEKWACKHVQETLQENTGTRSYTQSDPLRLLQCTDQCKAFASFKEPKAAHAARTPDVNQAAQSPTAPEGSEGPGERTLNKEEKRREREEKRLARVAAQEQADRVKLQLKRLGLAAKVLAAFLVISAGIVLGLVLFRVAAPEEL